MDMEVNSRRTPTLVFETPLQLAAKPESCLILMVIVVTDRHISLGIRKLSFFWPYVH